MSNYLYRWLLYLFFRLSQVDGRTRWLVLAGGYVLVRLMWALTGVFARLGWWQGPIFMLYALFACFVWLGDAIFTLLLRLDPVERLALSAQEVRISNYVAGLLFLALLLLATGLLLGINALYFAALGAAMLVLPLTGTLRTAPGYGRTILTIYTSILSIIGALGFVVGLTGSALSLTLAALFFLGCVGFPWLKTMLAG